MRALSLRLPSASLRFIDAEYLHHEQQNLPCSRSSSPNWRPIWVLCRSSSAASWASNVLQPRSREGQLTRRSLGWWEQAESRGRVVLLVGVERMDDCSAIALPAGSNLGESAVSGPVGTVERVGHAATAGRSANQGRLAMPRRGQERRDNSSEMLRFAVNQGHSGDVRIEHPSQSRGWHVWRPAAVLRLPRPAFPPAFGGRPVTSITDIGRYRAFFQVPEPRCSRSRSSDSGPHLWSYAPSPSSAGSLPTSSARNTFSAPPIQSPCR